MLHNLFKMLLIHSNVLVLLKHSFKGFYLFDFCIYIIYLANTYLVISFDSKYLFKLE